MDQGEGVEGADLKEDPLDFALWKAQKEGEDTAWDSPWGRGRPGWHIECSAMAEALLGLEFDIHGGGIDLVFPHHENEAAQTAAARGRPLARSWMHNGMLEASAGEKMAKSVGNIRGLADVLDDVGGDALVLFFSTGHYRQPLAYSAEGLEAAASSARGSATRRGGVGDGRLARRLAPQRDAFWDALADDYNTPRALAALYEWIGEANKLDGPAGVEELAEMLRVLGLESLLEADGGAARGASRSPSSARRRGATEGLGRGGPPARRAAAMRLGGPRRPAGTGARQGVLSGGRWSSTAATRCGRRCAAAAACTRSGRRIRRSGPARPPRRPRRSRRAAGPTPTRASAPRSTRTRTPTRPTPARGARRR